jgi:hypothetical protein
MKKLTHYLIYGTAISCCLCTSCFESESQRRKAYESDKCKETSGEQTVLFGGVPWGASRDQVIAAMGKQPTYADNNTVIFDDHISGMPVHAVFFLADDQLTRGKYIFTTRHPMENTYLEKFGDIEKILAKKYGEPAVSDTTWNNNMFKYVYKDYGLAVSLGHMSMLAGWKIGCVKLSHTLSGGNGQIQHGMEYYHLKMLSIEENAKPGIKL